MPSGFDICVASEGYAIRLPDGGCTSYWDKMGCVWTIGFGSTGPDIGRHTTWTRAQAVQRLQLNWQQTKAGVLRASPILAKPEHANRLDAITDFAYNVGTGRYQSSSLRAYVNRQAWGVASAEFPKWNLAGGKVRAGLVTRREAERRLFLTPVSASSPDPSSPDSASGTQSFLPDVAKAPGQPFPSSANGPEAQPSAVPSVLLDPTIDRPLTLDSAGVLQLAKELFRKLLG